MAGQAAFTVEIECGCPPREAISRVLDLRQHSRIIPLTTVTPAVGLDELQVGSEFVARTGLGRLGFDDVMRIDVLERGNDHSAVAVAISKHGRAIRGEIWLRAAPSAGGSVVSWHQVVDLPWLPSFLQPLAARVLKLGYRAVLARLLAADAP